MAERVDLGIGAPPVRDEGEPDVYGDPGPGPQLPPVSVLPPVDMAPEVPEPVVRGMLAGLGSVLAMTPLADPDLEDHWRFTAQELDDLTPPITRIVNARPQLRAAAARGDEVTVAVQLAGYVGRNIVTGSLAKRARQQAEAEEWMPNGDVDREADRAAGSGDPGARGAAGGEPGGWVPPAPGVGVYPPST